MTFCYLDPIFYFYFVGVMLLFGSATNAVLQVYSQLCTQHSLLVLLGRPYVCGFWNLTRVGYLQGKFHNHCTNLSCAFFSCPLLFCFWFLPITVQNLFPGLFSGIAPSSVPQISTLSSCNACKFSYLPAPLLQFSYVNTFVVFIPLKMLFFRYNT